MAEQVAKPIPKAIFGLTKNFTDVGERVSKILKNEYLISLSFKNLRDMFMQCFPSLCDRFKATNVIFIMLQNTEFFAHSGEKVAAIGLIIGAFAQDLYQPQISQNPFCPLLFSLLTSPEVLQEKASQQLHLSEQEKRVIGHLFFSPLTQRIWMTPLSALLTSKELTKLPTSWLQELELVQKEQLSNLLPEERAGISCYISDPQSHSESEPTRRVNNIKESIKQESMIGEALETLLGENEDNRSIPMVFDKFIPEFITWAPPIYFIQDELVWMTPLDDNFFKVMIDERIGNQDATGDGKNGARDLINLACTEAFPIPQRDQFIAEIKEDPELITILGLTPEKLPSLVVHNPKIALQLLSVLLQTQEGPDYLSVLVRMEVSVQSIDFVNRLTGSVELPREFLYKYISNCIKTCESIEDKYVQTRLVRVVCVFLQWLVRNRTTDVRDLYFEIQTFGLYFSRVKQAAALYRLIKQVENEESQVPSSIVQSKKQDDGHDKEDPEFTVDTDEQEQQVQ